MFRKMRYCDYLTKGKVLNREIYLCKLHIDDIQVIGNPGSCSEEYHHNCYTDIKRKRKEKLEKINASI
jgi:hypothetical protein